MTMELNAVIRQRVREAVKAERAGHAVTFIREEGGAGHVLSAMYKNLRHVICTCGTAGTAFAELEAAVRAEFAAGLEGDIA